MYATPDGIRQANITSIANNEAERLQFSQAMVGRLKGIIEAKLSNLPKPTYPQNYIIPSNPVAYKWYSYTLITTMNTTGYSDYPASVKVKYTTPNGPKETPVLQQKMLQNSQKYKQKGPMKQNLRSICRSDSTNMLRTRSSHLLREDIIHEEVIGRFLPILA
jgi:hypothetical protein